MEAVQVVMEKALLRATDQGARRTRQNRSAFVRDAIRDRLRKLEIKEMEERETAGYVRLPQTPEEINLWKGQTAWLDE